jgi:hypothetical protein
MNRVASTGSSDGNSSDEASFHDASPNEAPARMGSALAGRQAAFSDLSAEERMPSPILRLEEETADAGADYAIEDVVNNAIGVRLFRIDQKPSHRRLTWDCAAVQCGDLAKVEEAITAYESAPFDVRSSARRLFSFPKEPHSSRARPVLTVWARRNRAGATIAEGRGEYTDAVPRSSIGRPSEGAAKPVSLTVRSQPELCR